MRIMLAVALAAAISMPTLAFGADGGGDKAKARRICKEITRTGSHLPPRRICKTAAQWQAYENDREQLRRDISNDAACAGASSCTSD